MHDLLPPLPSHSFSIVTLLPIENLATKAFLCAGEYMSHDWRKNHFVFFIIDTYILFITCYLINNIFILYIYLFLYYFIILFYLLYYYVYYLKNNFYYRCHASRCPPLRISGKVSLNLLSYYFQIT
jgi:hypothetical protein